MTQPASQRQRELDALAYLFSNQRHFPEFEFKLAEPSDIPALLHLERYCFNPFLAFGPRRWRYLISKSSCSTILLLHQGVLIAYLCLLPHQGWGGMEVRALAVHWSYRKKGLGCYLMRLSKELALQWHFRRLYLSVDCENAAALALYQQCGLKISRTLAHYYGLERHGLRMRLNLAQQDNIVENRERVEVELHKQ